MSSVYESIIEGLNEAIDDAKSNNKKLCRKTITVTPIKKYAANDIKRIRNSTGMTQRMFAYYMGVSHKTVESWECGTNQPSGTASRLLNMMEIDNNLTTTFPFVKCG